MARLSRRQVVRIALAWAASTCLLAVLATCGQPEPTTLPAGAAPGGAPTLTPSPLRSTAEIAATQTAFAAVPTKSDLSPLAPTVVATLIVPTAVRGPDPTKIIDPTRPIPTHDPTAPCIRGGVAESASVQVQTVTAQLIVIGTVVQVLPARWDTADGQRPADPCSMTDRHLIYTPVRLRVEQVVKGRVETEEIELHAYGGTVGQDSLFRSPSSEYTFSENERVLVFVSSSTLRGQPYFSVVGRYTITADGMAIDGYSPSRRVPLQQLLNEIAEVMARPTAIPRPQPTATPR